MFLTLEVDKAVPKVARKLVDSTPERPKAGRKPMNEAPGLPKAGQKPMDEAPRSGS